MGHADPPVIKSPAIKICMNIRKPVVQALIDTGADISCMGKTFYQSLKGIQINCHPTSVNVVVAIGSNEFRPFVTADIPITLGGIQVYHQFLVFEGLQQDILLGMDFVDKYKVSISQGKQQVKLTIDGKKYVLPYIRHHKAKGGVLMVSRNKVMQGPVSVTPLNCLQKTADEVHRPQVEQVETDLGQADLKTGDTLGVLGRIQDHQGQTLGDSDSETLVKLPFCESKLDLKSAPMEMQEILLDTLASTETPKGGYPILRTMTGKTNQDPVVEIGKDRPHKVRDVHRPFDGISIGGKFRKVMQLVGLAFTFIITWMMTPVWTAKATIGAGIRSKTLEVREPKSMPRLEGELGGYAWGNEGTKTFHVGKNLQSSWEAFTNLQINHIILRDAQGSFIEDLTKKGPQLSPVQDEPVSFVDQLTKILDRPSTLTEEERVRLESFLVSREGAFRDIPGCSDLEVHRINTGNHAPIYRSPYQETPAKQKIIQEEVDNMLQLGLIEPSYSPWSSPVTLVKKSDGTCRFCIDYRALNKITLSDQFPMPCMAGMVRQLEGAKYLSSVDMTMGYYQCLVAEEDREKTAFTCSAGLFQFRVMPFGLKTAPSTFNRLMAKVLGPIRGRGALAYLDDILIYSPTFEQHLQDIACVFDLLQEANLFIKLKKCQFCRADFKFLGSILREGMILVDPEKTESVQGFKRPAGLKEVQRFLGLTGWLRRHVKDYALISRPLSRLTGGGEEPQKRV